MQLINLVKSAKTYASHGLSVIPIDRLSKRPLMKFADKPPLTPDEVEEVWQKFPLANIALKTDKFFVVDVDRHGEEDGTKAIKALNHPEWFNTLCEQTAHNGFHFFFLKPENKTIQQCIGFLPGVDIKAHPNNYVVVAPSVLGDKQYKWLNNKPIITAPDGLLKLIKQKEEEQGKLNEWQGATYAYDTGKPTRTTELFKMIATGLGDKGKRNDSLTSFVGGLLLRRVPVEVAGVLASYANANTPDPLPEKELETTFRSIVKKEGRKKMDKW